VSRGLLAWYLVAHARSNDSMMSVAPMTPRLRARPTNMLDNCSVLLGRIAVQSIRCGLLLLTMFRGLCVHACTQAVGISWRHVFTYKLHATSPVCKMPSPVSVRVGIGLGSGSVLGHVSPLDMKRECLCAFVCHNRQNS